MPENVALVWPLIRHKIAGVIQDYSGGEYTLDDLFDWLLQGKGQLWLVTDEPKNIRMVAVTKILQYKRVRRMVIEFIVGDGLQEAIPLLEQAESWMRLQNATQIEIHARPGLARVLQRREVFKQKRVVLLRDCNADLSKAQGQVERHQA